MKLKPLDVILFKGDWTDIADAIIMLWSKSPWTHCAWVKDEGGNIFDATIGGVLDRHISEYGERYRTVCRITEDLPDEKVKQILEWAYQKQKICQGYDILAWLGFGTGVEYFEDEDRYYCSEFPYWGFMENGLILTPEEQTFVYPRFFLYDAGWTKRELFKTILWEQIESEVRKNESV